MKKLILFACIFLLAACNGEDKSSSVTDSISTSKAETATAEPNLEDLISNKWMLESVTVTPAISKNGQTSSNYLALQEEGGCLQGDFTYVFLKSGVYQNFSTGSKCNLLPNSDDQKWSLVDNKITLTNKYGSSNPFIFHGNNITQTGNFLNEEVNHTIVYVYKPVKLRN